MPEKSFYEGLIDKIFSLKTFTIYFIGIFVLGFFLRLIAGINLLIDADSTHFVTHAINFLSSGHLVVYDQSSGLWYIFTDFIYKIFGISQFSSSFASLLFGSLSIPIIYLLTKEFFDEKTSLIAAFLLAIAPFHIKNTIAGMDVMAMFFVLLSILLFVRALKHNKNILYLFSGISLGLAVYTKVYPLLFVPSLLLYATYFQIKHNNKVFTQANIAKISIFLLAIFVFCIPALTHNYLLYKDKGFLDLQFTRTLDLGKNISAQYYSWDYQFNAKNEWSKLIFGNSESIPTLLTVLLFILKGDPIVFILGFLGAISLLLLRRELHKDYVILFLLLILFALPFLGSIMVMSKHYVFLELFLIPLAAKLFLFLGRKIKVVLGKNAMIILCLILLFFSLIYLGLPSKYTSSATHFYGGNNVNQIDSLKKTFPQNSLLIGDNRIYRGRLNWAFYGYPSLEFSQFIELYNMQDKMPGNAISVETYFFECVSDDCGWGTIKGQPELNNSMETLFNQIKNGSTLVKVISEPAELKSYYPLITQKQETIRVYKMNIPMKSGILSVANQPKSWFLYDTGYPKSKPSFDSYKTSGFFSYLLSKLARFIFWLSLLFTFLSILYVIILIYLEEINSTSKQAQEI